MHKSNLLYIIALLVVLCPGRAVAQNYADSTIVYLEWVSDPTRTMVINWIEADTTGIATVYYRVRNSSSPWTMSAGVVTQIPDATVKRKSVRLTGLTPGTEYGFRLGDSLSTKSHYFRTMPANLNNPVRFIVSGDVYGDGTDPEQETANFIESAGVARQLDPHFAIFAGDLIHLNEANEYNANSLNRFFKMLSEYTKYMRTPGGHYIPLVAGMGNHELPQRFGGQPADAKHFNALFNFPGNRGYNTLDFGDYLSLIMLNTDHTARIEGAQTDWLEAQLSARRNVVNVFPVYHVAAYPGKRPFVPGRGYEVRQYWTPLFDRYNVRFAFEHDNHGYKRTEPLRAGSSHPCGVRYIGEGGFAIPLGPVDTTYDYLEQQWNVRHVVNVELTQTSRRIQTFASSTGFLIDVHSQNTRIAPPGIQLATNIQATAFTANWNPNCNADGYRLDVSTDPNFTTFVSGYQNRNVGDTYSLNITGLTPLTTYYYRVRAVNSFLNQTSGNSNTLELTTSSLPPNVNPATNITAGSFTASWDAIQGADQYALDVSTTSNFSSFLSGFENRNVGNNLSFQVSGLQPATPYYYRVRARSSLGNQSSANSTVVGLITLTQPPILSEATQISSSGFQINWTQVVRADQYVVDVSSDSTFTTFLSGYNSRSAGNNSSLLVTGLAPLTQYFYRVRSRNTTLNVTSFNSTLGRTVTPSSPPLVRNAINVTSSGFTARWQSVQGVNRYYFDLATDANFEQYVAGFENYNAGNAISIDLSDLQSAQVYYYRVRASNTATDLTSENSNTIRVVTIPDAPSTLPATQVTPRSFVANWSEVQRVDTYLLDVSTDSEFTSFIPDYQNRAFRNTTSAEVIELSPNRVYYYRVRASHIENEVTGSYSNVSSISTILDAPESLTLVAVGTSEVMVSWSQAENATEYFIDVARDEQFSNLLSGYTDFSVGNVTEISIEGLESVESYYFRVRAGGQEDQVTSAYSEPLSFTTIPFAPELSEASSIRAVGFTANWSEVGKVTYYELEVAYNETFTQAFENFIPLNVGDLTTYIFTDVLPNTTLFFRVRAVNNTFNVVSEWSEVRSVTTVAIDPILSTVEVSQTSVLANGTDSSVFTITMKDARGNPLDGVSVQLIADSGDSVIQAIQDRSDDSGITRFRITNNKAEFVRYRVRAIQTDLDTETEIAFTPIAPTALTATDVVASSLTVNWSLVNGATSYRLDISENASFSSYLEGMQDREVEAATRFELSGLYPGNAYFYRVRAVAPTGTSLNSNVVNVVTLQADPNLTAVELTQRNILADGTSSVEISVLVRGTDGQPMSGVPVRLETEDVNAVVTTINGVSDQNGLTLFKTSSDFAGEVSYTVFAGRVQINTTAIVNFIPIPPVAIATQDYGTVGFTARWQSVQGVDRYYFDLATDANFEQYVAGFENYNVGNATSIDLSDLQSAQVYYYRVRASNSATDLTSANSNTIRVVTIPDAPSTLPATQVTPRSFVANWSEVQRVDTYLLDVSTDSEFTSFIPDYQNRAFRNTTSAEVIELSPNRVYYYRVRASHIENEVISSYSNVSSISTILDAPESLTLLAVGTSEVMVSWSQAENATEYFIDVARDVQFSNLLSGYTDFSVGNVTEITIEGLESVESYYFRVRAGGQEDQVTSAYSEPLSFTTIPFAPELSEASSIRAVGFTANWSEVEKVTYYELEVAYNETFTQVFENFSPLNVGDVTTYTLTDVLPNTVLFFRVRAVNNTLNVVSEWSEVRSVTTIAIDPVLSTVEVSQPSVLANGTDSSAFTITIKDARGNPLDGVSVQLIADSGDSVIQAIQDRSDDSGITRFRVTNDKAEFVRYRVRAIQTDLDTETEIAFTPIAPTALTATDVVASSLTVNWSLVNGATSYRLDISENASFSSYLEGMQDREVEAATRFELSGLYPGNAYFYRVRAVAPTGTSLNSNVVNVVTPQADPNLTAVELMQRNILADGASSVEISVLVRGTDGQPMSGVPVRLETEDVNSVVTTINGVSDQNGLTLFKTSSDFAGEVSYTVFAGRVQINTTAVVNFIPIPPVAIATQEYGAVDIIAKWEKVNGATHYLLDVARDAGFEQILDAYKGLNTGNTDELNVINLTPGVTYYYRVRAATPTATSAYSNTISVTTYIIDLVNSTAKPSASKILANGEQKSDVEIKLLSDTGEPLSGVLVTLIPNATVYTIEVVQDRTDLDGVAKFSVKSSVAGEGEFTVLAGGLELEQVVNVVFLFADGEIRLGYNFPNPFGVSTRIPVTIPERMRVKIDVYNSFGQRVAELEEKEFVGGYFEIPFFPRGLSSGVYIVRMIADGKVLTQKMMYVK